MTITEYIHKLEQLRAEHGDLQVVTYNELYTMTEPKPLEVFVAADWDHGDFPVGAKVVLI